MIVLENHTENTYHHSIQDEKQVGKSISMPAGAPTSTSFDEKYVIHDRLHRGTYGSVYVASKFFHPEQKYAVKIIDRDGLKAKDDKGVFREAVIMKEVAHMRHASHLVDFYVTDKRFYIVQELATGGDMFDWIADHGPYKEADARKLAIRLLQTIQAFHNMGIVHRDLKPENILLAKTRDNTAIQVADWGFANHLPDGKRLTRRCGTPAFIAPEILSGRPYDEKVDLWSTGCILYMALCAYPPFYGKHIKERSQRICKGEFKFHTRYWAGISPEAKEVICGLLTVDPKQRWSPREALQSAWLRDHSIKDDVFD